MDSPTASSWCALAAIGLACERTDDFYLCKNLLEEQAQILGYNSVFHLNETASHDVVLTMFDRAIQKEEQ